MKRVIRASGEYYFGYEASAKYGDLIAEKLSGKTVSKRKATAEEPGGLIYEANRLGIDMYDLLEALEGMCTQGRAREIDDSTYKILGASCDVYSSEDFDDYEDDANWDPIDDEELLDILDELSDMGYDIHDESDIEMGLGAGLGYDKEDQKFIMKNLRKRKIISSKTSDDYDEIYSSTSPNSVANKYPEYMKVSRGRQHFSVHYNLIDNSPSADAHQMWLEFQASVSSIHPYDDAEYAWAQIENGHINVIKDGKVIQQYYYFDADDMDIENTEWCDAIIEQAIDYISEINDKVQPRIIHNSAEIDDTLADVNNTIEDNELELPEQEYHSEKTSINAKKLPAIFKLVRFKDGTVNLDFGGGRFDNVQKYFDESGNAVKNLVLDPYNRSSEHNQNVIKEIKQQGGADTATCSNVLNVIKEPEARLAALRNIKRLVKPDGAIYITVYEGSKTEDAGPTKSGFQLNRSTADYLDEIRKVFPDAERKGKLIVAHNF